MNAFLKITQNLGYSEYARWLIKFWKYCSSCRSRSGWIGGLGGLGGLGGELIQNYLFFLSLTRIFVFDEIWFKSQSELVKLKLFILDVWHWIYAKKEAQRMKKLKEEKEAAQRMK